MRTPSSSSSLVKTSLPICVSHTVMENTVLRGSVSHEHVSVIPNAVDSVASGPEQQRRVIIIMDVVKIVIDSICKTVRVQYMCKVNKNTLVCQRKNILCFYGSLWHNLYFKKVQQAQILLKKLSLLHQIKVHVILLTLGNSFLDPVVSFFFL